MVCKLAGDFCCKFCEGKARFCSKECYQIACQSSRW